MIRIKRIPLSKVHVGMKVAHNVYSELGSLLVNKDIILDFRHLKKLRSLGIQSIDVYLDENRQELDLQSIGYMAVLEEVRKFLNRIKSGEKIELATLTNIVQGVKTIRRNEDIMMCLNENLDSQYYAFSHTLNVALLAMMIGKWLILPEREITHLVYAGILHDIGKMRVDPEIMNKPGKLTEEEFEQVKQHPALGYRLLDDLKFLSKNIKYGVLLHHEREDGSGYPLGCKGDKIPEVAKIIAVADIYDAMTSKRVYSQEVSPFKVFKIMEDQSYGRLDLNITKTLLSKMANFYVGQRVILSNEEKGEIVFINPNRISSPIVKTSSRFIDLSMESNIKIERVANCQPEVKDINDEE